MNRWTALVPVKPWGLAKSRITLTTPDRHALARAFTLDLLDVLDRTPDVGHTVVVTEEAELLSLGRAPGRLVLPDPAGPPNGLNRAIAAGRAWAERHRGADPVVVVPVDLPCLTPNDLAATLGRLRQHARAFVPDSSGHGTTLVTSDRPANLTYGYEGASADRHRDLRMPEVNAVAPGVRHDVDTLDALDAAHRIGIHGRRTREVLSFIDVALESRTMVG